MRWGWRSGSNHAATRTKGAEGDIWQGQARATGPQTQRPLPHPPAPRHRASGPRVVRSARDCVGKKAPMPESVTDRFTSAHEKILMLSKSPNYYFDQEAVKEPSGHGYEGERLPNGKTAGPITGSGQGLHCGQSGIPAICETFGYSALSHLHRRTSPPSPLP
jgi:hypothetical protein